MSNVYKGSKTDFSYLVGMSLQRRMPWETLALLLRDLAPTLEETREIISILLKELEALQSSLQKKHKEFEEFQNHNKNSEELMQSDIHDQNNFTLEPSNDETLLNTEAMEEDIEAVDFDEEKSINLDKSSVNDISKQMDKNDQGNESAIRSMKEIDNEWYTFVTNDKSLNSEVEKLVDSSEFEGLRDEKTDEKSKAKYFQCRICEKSFNRKYNLKKHERIHTGEFPFECQTCKKKFNQKHQLQAHERIHTGEAPFECKICKKRFRENTRLKLHEKIHFEEAPYKCETCKKRFNQKSNLQTHERTHTGEVPYGCKTCKKRFKQLSALKTHEKIHTGTFPYECNTCNKRFRVKSTLTIHERIHTGEKPYECERGYIL